MNSSKAIQSAIESYQAGNLQQAADICKKILKKQPNNVRVLHFLGIVYYQLENYDSSRKYLTKAIQFDPSSYEGYYNLGRVFQKRGEIDEAIACYQKVILLNPAFADAYINLGNVLRDTGKPDEAIACYQKIAGYDPTNAGVYFNLGVAFQDRGQIDEAIASYQKALALNLNIPGIHNNLGLALQSKGEIGEAISCFQKALELDPRFAEAHYNLGNLFRVRGKFDEAAACYRRAIQCRSGYVDAYNNLGITLKDKGQVDEAIICYQRALRINPECAEAYNNFGIALYQKGLLDQAVSCLKKALSINPNFAKAYNALGTVLKDKGQHDEAEMCLRRALQSDAAFSSAYSNLLFYMNYNPKYSAYDIFSEHLRFAERFAGQLFPERFPHAVDRYNHRLRIGYVSPDFRKHSVAFFIEPVLGSHDRKQFEIFCYSDVLIEDEVTERIQGVTDRFRRIAGMTDEEVAEMLRMDEIDILIDLAGHTANNRMLLFARRPVPVQASWIGYPATTGLSTMDYKIVDSYTDPPGMTEQFYTEKLIRLPCSFLCYMSVSDSPDIGSLPALASGHVTFGSFNNLAKVSPAVIETWLKILKGIPGSRLVMKAKSFSDRPTRDHVMELFTKNDVGSERIDLVPWEQSVRGHLDMYNHIDIGLDTFPYNGVTTTCEALWMGVPVITLARNVHASRVGASLLSNVGIPELVAETCHEYVEIAVNLAADIERLKTLRGSLRGMMSGSPLTDAKRLVVNLENCYRAMWEKWCNLEG